MGMDAYAIDRDRKRLPTRERTGTFHPELINAEQQRKFAGVARELARQCDGIDADFDVGALCISAHASAVNHLLYFHGARSEDGCYTPEQVLHAALRMRTCPPAVLAQRHMGIRPDAMAHADAFIQCCASLGLGIDISP